jgi:AcrR family transcriptional regulator
VTPALYTVFADLDALILEINSDTLKKLDAEMTKAVEGVSDSREAMQVLASTYLDFARAYHFLWKALFQFQYPPSKQLPVWYAEDQARLLAQIIKPLAKLQPDFDQAALIVRARTLFAAVHGIISISLEERFVGVPIGTLDKEVEQFIDQLILGLEKRKEQAGAKQDQRPS